MSRVPVLLVVAAGTVLAGSLPAAGASDPCRPAGSRMVKAPVVTWQGRFYFCVNSPRQLHPLPVPAGTERVAKVARSGNFLAFAYYRGGDACDNPRVGARSIDLRTGLIRRWLHAIGCSYDIYGWGITDLVLRGDTGDFAVIRHMYDLEDGFDEDIVLAIAGSRPRALDQQDALGGDERRNPSRIVTGSLRYRDGRVYWRRADGRRSARLSRRR